jgi:hypothetical protein
MGEYATRRVRVTKENPYGYEQVCKVGTCDDWRYVRRSEAERLALTDAGGGTNIPHTLNEPSILYRFPFPWEDKEEHDLAAINNRSMFYTRTFSLAYGPEGVRERATKMLLAADQHRGPPRGGQLLRRVRRARGVQGLAGPRRHARGG